jgi:hypothetical protein
MQNGAKETKVKGAMGTEEKGGIGDTSTKVEARCACRVRLEEGSSKPTVPMESMAQPVTLGPGLVTAGSLEAGA